MPGMELTNSFLRGRVTAYPPLGDASGGSNLETSDLNEMNSPQNATELTRG